MLSFGGSGAGGGGTKTGGFRKQLVVMDEVDGMGGSDRGGIQELILLIKKSRVPIICICNDRQHQKIRQGQGRGQGRGHDDPSAASHDSSNGSFTNKRTRLSVAPTLGESPASAPGVPPTPLDSSPSLLPLRSVSAGFPCGSASAGAGAAPLIQSLLAPEQLPRPPYSFPASVCPTWVSTSSTWRNGDPDPGPSTIAGDLPLSPGQRPGGVEIGGAGQVFVAATTAPGPACGTRDVPAAVAAAAMSSPTSKALMDRSPSFLELSGGSGGLNYSDGSSAPGGWASVAALAASCVGDGGRGGETGDTLEASFKPLFPTDKQEEDRRLLGLKDERIHRFEKKEQRLRQWQQRLELEQKEQRLRLWQLELEHQQEQLQREEVAHEHRRRQWHAEQQDRQQSKQQLLPLWPLFSGLFKHDSDPSSARVFSHSRAPVSPSTVSRPRQTLSSESIASPGVDRFSASSPAPVEHFASSTSTTGSVRGAAGGHGLTPSEQGGHVIPLRRSPFDGPTGRLLIPGQQPLHEAVR